MSLSLNRLTLVALVAFSAISTDLYLSGIPLFVAEFGASEADGQLTLAVFMAGLAVGQLIYGPLSDHYGRKPILYVGVGLYVISSLVCALSASMEQLVLARLFQALAAACGPVLARAIVVDLYEPREAASVMAVLAASMALIPMVAPVLGSWMLYWFEWRAQFYALAIFGLLVFGGVVLLKESKPGVKSGRFSFKGLGRQLVDSLKHPKFVGFTLVGSAQFGAMFGWITSSSFVVIEQFSVAPEYFGYTFALVVLGYLIGAFISSRAVLRVGVSRVLGLGVALGIAAALLMMILALTRLDNLGLVLLAVFGIFMAGGLTISNGQVGATSVFAHAAGQASSVFGFLQTGVAALTSIFVGQFYDGTLVPLAIILCVMMAVSAAAYLTLLRAKSD